MIKKIVGICICILFLFSTYPVVIGANHNKKIEESLLTVNDDANVFPGFEFSLLYGIIALERETPSSYIIKPIFVREKVFGYDIGSGFYGWMGTYINTELASIPKDYYNHGFVHNIFMFIWGFDKNPY